MKRRIALFLSFIMIFSLITVTNVRNEEVTTQAAIKKSVTRKVGDMVSIQHSNLKTAKYTFSMDKKGYVSFFEYLEPQSQSFCIFLLKPGKVTVTIKQTYKKKTTKIATIKINIKKNTNSESEKPEYYGNGDVYITKGYTYNANYTMSYAEGSQFKSSNTSVASVDGNLITAKAVGVTTIAAGSGRGSSYKLHVVNSKITTTSPKTDEKIAELNKAKINKKNLKKLYNDYNSIVPIIDNCRDFDDDDNYIIKYALKNYPNKFEQNFNDFCFRNYQCSGESVSVLKVSKLTHSTMTVQLKHALTADEIVAKKGLYNGWLEFAFCVKNGNKKAYYYGTAKEGDKTITAKAEYKKNDVKKGKTFYYDIYDAIPNAKKWTITGKAIKAK